MTIIIKISNTNYMQLKGGELKIVKYYYYFLQLFKCEII